MPRRVICVCQTERLPEPCPCMLQRKSPPPAWEAFFPLTLKTPAELKYHIEHNLVSAADWGRVQQRKKLVTRGGGELYKIAFL